MSQRSPCRGRPSLQRSQCGRHDQFLKRIKRVVVCEWLGGVKIVAVQTQWWHARKKVAAERSAVDGRRAGDSVEWFLEPERRLAGASKGRGQSDKSDRLTDTSDTVRQTGRLGVKWLLVTSQNVAATRESLYYQQQCQPQQGCVDSGLAVCP